MSPQELAQLPEEVSSPSVLFDSVAVWLAMVPSKVEKIARDKRAKRMPKMRSAVLTGSISVPPKPS